jgi:hypothetical protein
MGVDQRAQESCDPSALPHTHLVPVISRPQWLAADPAGADCSVLFIPNSSPSVYHAWHSGTVPCHIARGRGRSSLGLSSDSIFVSSNLEGHAVRVSECRSVRVATTSPRRDLPQLPRPPPTLERVRVRSNALSKCVGPGLHPTCADRARADKRRLETTQRWPLGPSTVRIRLIRAIRGCLSARSGEAQPSEDPSILPIRRSPGIARSSQLDSWARSGDLRPSDGSTLT